MKTFTALCLVAILAGAADARPAPLDAPQRPAVERPAGEVATELASYFSFLRSFRRICYTYATGYVYC